MSFMSFIYLMLAGFVANAAKGDMESTMINIPIQGRASFGEMVELFGYKAVTHYVHTIDGYILTMFNIPGDRTRPLLYMHGLFDTGDGYFIRGNRSLGVISARKGYDVWVMNSRGNRYSRNHTTMDPDTNATFWEYSAHEYGIYDLRACIDHVLAETGQKQVSLIGFSEGTTAAFILGASNTEYNDKVKLFIALAPVVYLDNVRPFLSYIIQWSTLVDFLLPQSLQEVAGFNSMSKAVINVICTQFPISYEVCYHGGMNIVSGPDPDGIEREFLPVVVGHFPAGTSRKNLMHFAQIGLKSRFARYDYGIAKNWDIYRAFSPPEYDVSKVTMKTVLVSGKNDPVSTLDDVETLKNKLPNVEEHIVIENPLYNHLDLIWAKDAYLEHEQLFDLLAKEYQ